MTPSGKNNQRYNSYSGGYNNQGEYGYGYSAEYKKDKPENNKRYESDNVAESQPKVESHEDKKEPIKNKVETPKKESPTEESVIKHDEIIMTSEPKEEKQKVPSVEKKVHAPEPQQPLKTKVIVDDEDEYILKDSRSQNVVPESEIETDALDTPLKPRSKALEDTVESKKIVEIQPKKEYNLKSSSKEDSSKAKKI